MPEEKDKVKCPNCNLLIGDTKTLRCPRCNTPLIQPGCSGSCSKCNLKGKECS